MIRTLSLAVHMHGLVTIFICSEEILIIIGLALMPLDLVISDRVYRHWIVCFRGLADTMIKAISVSYTHLDVYKRQI